MAMLLGPLDHLLAERLAIGSVFSGHKGFRPLAPVRVCDGADADFEDGGVCAEHGFEGDGGDVFAACGVLVSIREKGGGEREQT